MNNKNSQFTQFPPTQGTTINFIYKVIDTDVKEEEAVEKEK